MLGEYNWVSACQRVYATPVSCFRIRTLSAYISVILEMMLLRSLTGLPSDTHEQALLQHDGGSVPGLVPQAPIPLKYSTDFDTIMHLSI
jgi:hypothetical protein